MNRNRHHQCQEEARLVTAASLQLEVLDVVGTDSVAIADPIVQHAQVPKRQIGTGSYWLCICSVTEVALSQLESYRQSSVNEKQLLNIIAAAMLPCPVLRMFVPDVFSLLFGGKHRHVVRQARAVAVPRDSS